MRLKVRHEMVARFAEPASFSARKLRLTPRNISGQYVRAWRIDVDSDCRQDRAFDAFGNLVHDFTLTGPIERLTIVAEGEVEVDDTAGVLQGGGIDRLPVGLFLRETPATAVDAALRAFADDVRAASDGTPLDLCHQLMQKVGEKIAVRPSEPSELCGVVEATASDALAAGKGSAADLAHVFIAAARCLALPARYISGYLRRGPDVPEESTAGALHAWAEAMVPGLGWVGFDPVLTRCPTDAYVRVATSLDQSGAAWSRGYDRGNSPAETLVTARVEPV